MLSEFQNKKLPFETLGEYLSSIRKDMGLTLEEVAHQTGVFEKFLAYLEQGKYNLLPADVYVVGFLKKIADLYQISAKELIGQYKRERGVLKQPLRQPENLWQKIKLLAAEISITPKILSLAGGLILLLVFLVYVAFQIFSVNKTPGLVILKPSSDTVLTGTTINIEGKTDPGMLVTINGQNVFVDPDGKFQQSLGVIPGQKDFMVVAKNKFGKIKQQPISLRIEEPKVAGASTLSESEQQQVEPLKLTLQASKQTQITLEVDGILLETEILGKNSEKTIEAKEKIVVKTSDAGSTKAIVNGKSLGVLGKNGQVLTIPFTKESKQLLNN